MGNNWFIWILLIFFFIMFNGGVGNFGNTNGTVNTLTNEFLYTNLNSTIDRGFNQIANQGFSIQQDMCNGFNSTQRELMENRFVSQQCCCETNRNIDAIRYENAKNTCDIITAGNAQTQRIIDQMQNDKIDALRTELQSAQLALQNNAQTQTLISQLRPTPIPAYITCSPYTSYGLSGLTGGCGNSCYC